MEPIVAAGPPLDYSFKELKSCAELETEEPRGGRRRVEKDGARDSTAEVPASGPVSPVHDVALRSTGALCLAQTGLSDRSGTGPSGTLRAHSSPHTKRFIRKITQAVKLNNNFIESASTLPRYLDLVMHDPIRNLTWLDLSFNRLSKIEPELLTLVNLKALYLHGNFLSSLPSVERLRRLRQLISVTLNGNPFEKRRFYRVYVLGSLPQVKKLDHTSITEDEHLNAVLWYKNHMFRVDMRAKRAEEAYLDALSD